MRVFTAIFDRTLFRRIRNYNVQETPSLTTLLLLVLQKTRVQIFLEKMKILGVINVGDAW